MTPRTTEDAVQDVKMMETPGDWPRWPVLPVKQAPTGAADGWGRMGVILAYDRGYANGRIVVWETNLFTIPTKDHTYENGHVGTVVDWEALEAKPHHLYRDAEEVVDAGWMVD